MPMTTKERTELREELVGQGYSWEYVDDWPAKITLYRHREIKNPNGEIVSKAGTEVPGLPGNPDYVNRKARQGLLQWPPSETCSCKWCMDRRGATEAPVSSEEAKDTSRPNRRRGKVMGPHFKTS